jgi:NAD(P)-dependent dehydrogenase (short-subunit alcohol dehydrogenase family)
VGEVDAVARFVGHAASLVGRKISNRCFNELPSNSDKEVPMEDSRTAIVTGGSRGLGRALVAGLADQGWRVVTDARDAHALRTATADLGRRVVAVPGDITDSWHRSELVTAAGERIDLVVNNAGGLGPSPLPPLAAYPPDALAALFTVNVVAPLALIQEALPKLAAGGVIVNVTSDASVEAYEGWGGYGATKAALDHVGRVLAVERPDVRVLTIDPGDMRTQMHQDAFPGEDISDRPAPEASVPAILALVGGDHPSGRYRASEVVP